MEQTYKTILMSMNWAARSDGMGRRQVEHNMHQNKHLHDIQLSTLKQLNYCFCTD